MDRPILQFIRHPSLTIHSVDDAIWYETTVPHKLCDLNYFRWLFSALQKLVKVYIERIKEWLEDGKKSNYESEKVLEDTTRKLVFCKYFATHNRTVVDESSF